jgi:hypothetical protein
MKRMAWAYCLVFLAIGCGYSTMMTVNYGWEDGATILGNYLPIEATNATSPDPTHSGERSLRLIDGGVDTPEVYVAYITGLLNGETVSANLWTYDITPGPGVSPRARIWAHYVKNNNIDDFAGTAGGNLSYSDGSGWSNLGWNWTIDLGYDRTGLVIEVRTYSNLGDTVWIDDLSVTVPETAKVYVPGQQVPEPGMLWAIWLAMLVSMSGGKRHLNTEI